MKTGKLPESVWKRSVLKQINGNHSDTKELVSGASVGADCAIFAAMGSVATSIQEAAVAGKADIGRLLHRAANSLACAGATPIAATCMFQLPIITSEEEFQGLVKETLEVCNSLSISLAEAKAQVWPDLTLPHLTVTGIGKNATEGKQPQEFGTPGEDLVITKWIGLEGTAILANKYGEQLSGRYPSHLIRQAAEFCAYQSVLPEAKIARNLGVTAMIAGGEGGIFRSLWEMAERAGTGLEVDLKKIPIRQETVEVCEFFQVNPYELFSGGCLVLATKQGEQLVEELDRQGTPASLVGRLTDSNDRVVINQEETRFLERPKNEEIYKVEI